MLDHCHSRRKRNSRWAEACLLLPFNETSCFKEQPYNLKDCLVILLEEVCFLFTGGGNMWVCVPLLLFCNFKQSENPAFTGNRFILTNKKGLIKPPLEIKRWRVIYLSWCLLSAVHRESKVLYFSPISLLPWFSIPSESFIILIISDPHANAASVIFPRAGVSP